MSDSELDDVAADLYAADPAEFVAARKDAASAARKAGNRSLATAIGKLRKPTTVAWMVNLLVRCEPEDVADLFDLGDQLRDAQRRSAARELRGLSAARQQAIRTLTRRAVELADEHGRAASEDAAREVGQTLGAALADPEIGERVRAGRVVTAESYSGFGPAVLALAPEPEADQPQDDEPQDDTEETEETEETEDVGDDAAGKIPDEDSSESEEHAAALAEAEEQLDEAREDEEAARRAAEGAKSEAEEAARTLTDAKERLGRLRAELHEAEEAEADARNAEKSAARESRRLERVFADARARTSELQEAFDELG